MLDDDSFQQVRLYIDRLGSQCTFSEEFLTHLLRDLAPPLDEVRLDGTFQSARHPLDQSISLMYRAAVAYLQGEVVTCPVTWVDHQKVRIVSDRRCPKWLSARLAPGIRNRRYQARAYLPNMRFPKERFGPTIMAFTRLPGEATEEGE